MTASIFEQSDGSSFVVVTRQDGEYNVFDIANTDNLLEPDQIECELFNHGVFKYSLLGAPNADAEEISDVYNVEDE